MGTEELGITKIKFALKAVIDIVEDALVKAADGLQIDEILSLVVSAVPDAITVFKTRKEIVLESKDLSDEERAELSAYFSVELDIENEVAERLIEMIFSLLLSLVGVIDAVQDLKKEEE